MDGNITRSDTIDIDRRTFFIAATAGTTAMALPSVAAEEDSDVPLIVDLDVHSSLNPDSRGRTPVTLAAPDDSPTELLESTKSIDVESLRFGSPSALGIGKGASPASYQHSGEGSLHVKFPTQNADFAADDELAGVVGSTDDGRKIVGSVPLDLDFWTYDRGYWDLKPEWPDWPWSPDEDWRVAGPWHGTGGNYFHPDHADLVETYGGEENGYLLLSVQGTGPNGELEGAEIEAREVRDEPDNFTNRFTYGYYETRMKVPTGPGVFSFFWKTRGPDFHYGRGEIDIEFVTEGTLGNADEWGEDEGYVWFVIHPGNDTHEQALGFDPSADFHRYGFLWTPAGITWTVDGEPVFTNTDLPEALSLPEDDADKGSIMMNAWVGNEHWGGADPPEEDQTAVYDYVWYVPGATRIPDVSPR